LQVEHDVLRTLIVDDEPIARRVLREELEIMPDIAVVGEAQDGREALQRIKELQPDLVFLDLQMPVMGGFEVVRQIEGGKLPMIVISTAFDDHAIQAFEAGAVDYLLKPVSEVRLKKTVERAKSLRHRPLEIAEEISKIAAAAGDSGGGATKARKVVGRDGAEYFLLDPDEILAFQADGELVWIITSKRRLLATQTLRAMEDRLRDHSFQRVHRNAIVNVNHVRKMSAMSSQRWLVTLSNSLQVVVSKRQAHNIREMLH
jgi:two-component system LytT family response regulator